MMRSRKRRRRRRELPQRHSKQDAVLTRRLSGARTTRRCDWNLQLGNLGHLLVLVTDDAINPACRRHIFVAAAAAALPAATQRKNHKQYSQPNPKKPAKRWWCLRNCVVTSLSHSPKYLWQNLISNLTCACNVTWRIKYHQGATKYHKLFNVQNITVSQLNKVTATTQMPFFEFLGRLLRVDLIKWVSNVHPPARPSIRPSVRPSTKRVSDLNEIFDEWCMKVCSINLSKVKVKVTSPWKSEIRPFSKAISSPIYNGSWQMTTDS